MQERMLQRREGLKLMTVSHKVRQQLTETLGVPPEEVTVLYPGVDLGRFHPVGEPERAGLRRQFGRDPDELSILFVGHNFILKGLGQLLCALGEARRMNVRAHLSIAGNGDIRGFRKFAQQLGISSDVTFLGGVSQQDLVRRYQTADVLMHPTFYDACSLVVIESLACGCPVVTTENNGASELIESGVHGFLLKDPRDASAMADVLCRICDPNLRSRMGKAAALLGSRCDIKSHAAKVMAWLWGAEEPEQKWR
jgi:UDP-glucose:(heptosyl)LPS alpha-1,3-glucosyltransferase